MTDECPSGAHLLHLLGNRDDLSAVLTIRGHANFSLLKRRDRVRNRRKELMKIFVEVPSHLHQASNEIMSILLCLVNGVASIAQSCPHYRRGTSGLPRHCCARRRADDGTSTLFDPIRSV